MDRNGMAGRDRKRRAGMDWAGLDGAARTRRAKRPPSGGRTPRGTDLEEAFATLWGWAGDGTKPVREYRFCFPRRFRFDFAFVEEKVAVEMQGLPWTKPGTTMGHNSLSGVYADCEKFRLAMLNGWKVLPVTAKDLSDRPAQIMDQVKECLAVYRIIRS